MHNIDRTLQEFGSIGNEYQNEYENTQEMSNEFGNEFANEFENAFGNEYSNEFGNEYSNEYSNEFSQESSHEQLEMEMTYELMAVTNEMELNHFLGGLMKKALGAAKGAATSFINSSAGKSVGNYLVNFGKKTLPQLATKYGGQALGALGGKVGNAIGGKVGGQLGSTIASGMQKGGTWLGQQGGAYVGGKAGDFVADKAKQIFNLEFEGLSPEDREFEIARSFVRFSSDLARRSYGRYRRNPRIAVRDLGRQSIYDSASRYAPGLLVNDTPDMPISSTAGAMSGRWIRQNGNIVILGA